MVKVGNEVIRTLKSAGESDELRSDSRSDELLLAELAVCSRCGVQAAAACICNVGFDSIYLKTLHKRLGSLSAALNAEADDTAGAVGHILLCEVVVLIALKSRVGNPINVRMVFKEFCNGKSVFAVALHSHMQALKSEVDEECTLRCGGRAEITHQLSRCLCDICALTEFLGINYSVIAVVGSTEPGEFLLMSHPIKVTRINDTAADLCSVTVHILCRCMSYNVNAKFKGTAVNRCCKGIVDYNRNAVTVRCSDEFIKINNGKCGICNSFSKNCLCIRAECRIQLLFGAVRGYFFTFKKRVPTLLPSMMS